MNEIVNTVLLKNDITATFDLETTGVNPETDRICQIAITKRYPDGRCIQKTYYINPLVPIPEGASNVHGITNEMVANCKTFEQMATTFYETLKDCTLIGFNSDKFDVPMIHYEFSRCGIVFPLPSQHKVDVRSLYLKLYPNTLGGIYNRLTGKILEGAHDATNDINATDEILKIILNKPEVQHMNSKELDVFINGSERYLDIEKQFLINEYNQYVWAKGKHTGRCVLDDDKDVVSYNTYISSGASKYHSSGTVELLKKIISRQI